MKSRLNEAIVIKIGGSTFGKHQPSGLDISDVEDIVELQRRGIPMIIVHGGGKMITEWLEKQAIATKFIRGERVTDRPALEVVISVLAGLVNKELVALLNSHDGKAVGISGVDGALLEGKVKRKEMGFVGTVTAVNVNILDTLLASGFIPVVAPLSIHSSASIGNGPQILNVNGDTVAGEIAAAIAAERLIFLTDIDGVHDKEDNLISHLSPAEAEELLSSEVAFGGMIPKVRACLKARAIEGNDIGTTIHADIR